MNVEQTALRRLGLTEYESRCYLALLAAGGATAPETAAHARVPRTKVYVVLRALIEKGWASADATRPKQYHATRPRDALGRAKTELDAMLERAMPTLEAQFVDRAAKFAGPLWTLRDPAAIAKRGIDMARDARHDVLLVASWPLPRDDDLAQTLVAAAKRGVRIRLVVPDRAAPSARPFIGLRGVEVRVARVPPRLLACDGAQVLLAAPGPGEPPSEGCKALWNPSAELLDIMGAALSGIWSQAESQPS